jgi:hypothetical protein
MNIIIKRTIIFTLLIIGVVLLSEAAYRSQNRNPSPTLTKTSNQVQQVELDIFSGRPNPTWTLTASEASDLASRISKLTHIETKEQRPGNLGYRGFIVQDDNQTIRAYQGIIEVSIQKAVVFYRDPQRQVELWLLAIARPPLDQDLTTGIATEIMRGAP